MDIEKIHTNLTSMTLSQIEDMIREDKDHADRMALCFLEIHTRRLYKESFKSFEDYCREIWGFSRQHGHRMVDYGKTIKECNQLVTLSGVKVSESLNRSLKEISPEKRPEVLKKAQETGKLTAESIKKAADDVLGNNTQKPVSERPKTREEQLQEAWKDDKWSNVDSTGFPVPPESQDIWDRRDEPKWMLKAISDVRCALEKINKEGDLLYRELNYSKLKVELDAIRYDLKTAIPYAVCPKCQGRVPEDCDLCKARGFVSKFRYDRVVPIELKALRDNVIKAKRL